MKAAIVGCGVAGTARLEAYRRVPGTNVQAVVDPVRMNRERVMTSDPQVKTYERLDELLESDVPDLVDICAPPNVHAPLTIEALSAGCHVICEKPVTGARAEALRLVEHARSVERLLYPAHNYAFSSPMRIMRGAVAEGRIGSPMELDFRIERQGHALGVPSWRRNWRRDPSIAGGGILLDHGVHCMYMATRLFREQPIAVRCTAHWAESSAAEETADLTLDFPGGSCRIQLTWTGRARSNRYSIRGPVGSLDVIDGRALLRSAGAVEQRDLASPTDKNTHNEWFPSMFADFADALADPTRWSAIQDEAVVIATIVEGAYNSARSGQLIQLPSS